MSRQRALPLLLLLAFSHFLAVGAVAVAQRRAAVDRARERAEGAGRVLAAASIEGGAPDELGPALGVRLVPAEPGGSGPPTTLAVAAEGLQRIGGRRLWVHRVQVGPQAWAIGAELDRGAAVGAQLLVAGVATLGGVAWVLFASGLAGPRRGPGHPDGAAEVELGRTGASRGPGQVDTALARLLGERAVLQRSAEMLRRYLHRLSLELRTSLTAVIGYAELVKEEALRARQWTASTDMDRVLVGAHAALGLVEDTLALVALDRGDHPVQPEVFQLGTVLHEIISRLRPLAASLGTRIECGPGEAGSLHTDRALVRHILHNVIARAVHAAPAGLVEVLPSREGSAEVPWIRVQVVDDGPQLTQGQLDEIFAVAPPEASDAVGPGSSIGLLVARRFAALLGGDLSARADARGGTRLILNLPAHLALEGDGPGSIGTPSGGSGVQREASSALSAGGRDVPGTAAGVRRVVPDRFPGRGQPPPADRRAGG